MDVTTDSLRALAPKWSLAGDNRLLTLLQNTHQKIVTKCREVNTKLDEMVSALDVASISLQNVNNKFMALSNSQFIESRVYDDDGDVVADAKPTEEAPVAEMIDEISILKRGLAILDKAHETAEIVDDSDSDSDAEISVVLKPRDMYSHRPLPYTIGSQPWRNKWHSGLVVEDSDSDSSCPDVREGEQYSASEDEQIHRPAHDHTISDTSSFSERDITRDRDTSRIISRDTDVPKKQTPADIAAELAASLGQAPPRILEQPEEYRQPANKPVYRPQNPVTSTIFPDEPPPVDNIHSSESHDDDDDDIFAEINKKQPYNNNKDYVDDLFGKPVEGYNKEQMKSAKQKSTSYYDKSEPELFADKPQKTTKEFSQNKVADNEENTVKKPVGGISLFGSNKGTESIGAAILNRNRRKSFSSGNESDENTIKKDAADKSNSSEDADKNNANAIFDNLFAKAKKAEQKTAKQEKASEKKTPVKSKQIVKDLFSDNIFDDIDDIFTTNIKIPAKDATKNAKSIFDDDDDDHLFSDIPKANTGSTALSSKSNKKSIFDSDDELFSDVKITKYTENVSKYNSIDSVTEKLKLSQDKSSKEYKTPESANAEGLTNFDNPQTIVQETPKVKQKSIFDSDSDDDIFSNIKIKSNKIENKQGLNQNINTDHKTETEYVKDYKEATIVDNLKAEKAKVFQSPSLFEEDEIDDLFINANKIKIPESTNKSFNEKNGDDMGFNNNEESLKYDNVNQEENKSKTLIEDKKNVIDVSKPVIVDTKPYIFPKIDEPLKVNCENTDKNNIFIGSKKKETDVKNCLDNVKDIIETSQNTESVKVQNKSSSLDVGIKSKVTQLYFEDENKTECDNITATKQHRFDKDNEELMPDKKLDVDVEDKGKQNTVIENSPIPAAFDDIFSEPPAFEKFKETKKSTNVNALFEDDSDDEALFFKKNDVISDEKPDLFSPSANFAIFNDEPPALDDIKTIVDEFDDDKDIFSSVHNEESITMTNEPVVDEWDDNTPLPNHNKLREHTFDIESELFSSQEPPTLETKTEKLKTKVSCREVLDSDDELFSNVPKTSQKDKTMNEYKKPGEIKDTEKKFGKIDTTKININVQALVPGASPKKIHKEVTESYKVTEVIETVTEVDNAESKYVKSISFEDKPDSGVLDNNLSKQRPRIQVKRRPSSRKARHEAVRKSVLVVDDDTDNSSSFDESRPKPRPTIIPDKELKDESIQNQDVIKEKNIDKAEISSFDNVPHIKEHDGFKSGVIDKYDEIFEKPNEIPKDVAKSSFDETDTVTPKSTYKTENEINRDIAKSPIGSSTEKRKESKEAKTSESTTKVVYILNDEDIFSLEKPNENLTEKDDLFKNEEADKDLLKIKGITTIGSTYKENLRSQPIQTTKESSTKAQSKAKSLFDLSDDDDDDDLFGKNKKTVKAESKLFESDSGDDLFSGNKDKVKQKVHKKEVKKKEPVAEVKKVSLFGDNDDDDDLFGVKTKTVTDKNKPASSRIASKEAAQTTEIVFEDPLSMLE